MDGYWSFADIYLGSLSKLIFLGGRVGGGMGAGSIKILGIFFFFFFFFFVGARGVGVL